MGKRKKLIRIGGFILLSIALQILLFEMYGRYSSGKAGTNPYHNQDAFDPALIRLSTLDKMVGYCDSLYGASVVTDTSRYANIVGEVMRLRFYHGYSYYRLGQNFIGWALAPYIHRNLSAIVIPNDILKHPNAACSQQSIIGMELFKRKGFNYRKVGFYDPEVHKGHFCFEIFYKGEWHFFDPDKEPLIQPLINLDRPSIQELTANKKLLDSVYYKEHDKENKNYLLNFSYGSVNKFPAPRAIIYQYATKFLSWTLFFWLLMFGWWVWKRFKV